VPDDFRLNVAERHSRNNQTIINQNVRDAGGGAAERGLGACNTPGAGLMLIGGGSGCTRTLPVGGSDGGLCGAAACGTTDGRG
jgi:hypothetical protein